MSAVSLSYVVLVDGWSSIDALARRLAAQTVAGQVELVAVGAPHDGPPRRIRPTGR